MVRYYNVQKCKKYIKTIFYLKGNFYPICNVYFINPPGGEQKENHVNHVSLKNHANHENPKVKNKNRIFLLLFFSFFYFLIF